MRGLARALALRADQLEAVLGVGLVMAGEAMIYLPAALITGGLVLYAHAVWPSFRRH